MAFENYVHDISYLISGSLSDLTLHFGEKTWHIHRALAVCHSVWFRKALTCGLKETESGVITLNDEPEYANAIDCMVSYFYEAGYSASKYDTSGALLHAQVAILADKYDCTSLFKLAKSLFADTIENVGSDEWRDIAAFVYDFTTTESPAHVEIRGLVVNIVVAQYSFYMSIVSNESIVALLRSNADLATDLFLGKERGFKEDDAFEYLFTCDFCHYGHSGPQNCPSVSTVGINGKRSCPMCKKGTTGKLVNRARQVDLYLARSCKSCYGCHTLEPEV